MIVDTSAWVEYMRRTESAFDLFLDAAVRDGQPIATPAAVDLATLTRNRGGPIEQMLLKAWVIGIYSRWESKYRNQLKHENRDLPGAIRPLQQVLGDLGHIRNDLLHNGIAKRNDSGRCEILRWFKVGERMHLRLRHVFDFLNQMAWLTDSPAVIRDGPGKPSAWHIDRTGALEEPAPALVSVRPFVNPQESDTRYRYGASIAFENGVFVTIPMGPEREDTPA